MVIRMEEKVLVEVKDLKKYFKTTKGMLHAVDGVNFQIKKGTTLGVVGESGCGKSTLGRLLLHLHKSTGGQIIYDGVDITGYNEKQMHEVRKKMQMIFQDPQDSLDPRKSVKDLIGEPLKNYKVCKTKDEYEAKVKEIMETVGLADRYAESYSHELDGGRRQRIGIGRALAMNPEFIVCDEPVSALDVSIQAQVLNLLMDLQDEKGLTYIFITHDLSVVEYISDRIAVMYLGRIVELADSDELYRHTVHPYTQALLSAIPVADIHHQKNRILLEGDVPSPMNPPSGCHFHGRCKQCKEICKTEKPELKKYEINGRDHYIACHFAEENIKKVCEKE